MDINKDMMLVLNMVNHGGISMESPRFENQSDAEDYIRELESKRQITIGRKKEEN